MITLDMGMGKKNIHLLLDIEHVVQAYYHFNRGLIEIPIFYLLHDDHTYTYMWYASRRSKMKSRDLEMTPETLRILQ
jgi:hypothetical protein